MSRLPGDTSQVQLTSACPCLECLECTSAKYLSSAFIIRYQSQSSPVPAIYNISFSCRGNHGINWTQRSYVNYANTEFYWPALQVATFLACQSELYSLSASRAVFHVEITVNCCHQHCNTNYQHCNTNINNFYKPELHFLPIPLPPDSSE